MDCFERKLRDACALIALHPTAVRIQVANRTPNREARSWASTLDLLNVSRQTNYFRLDVSALDGPDVIASDEDVARIDRLEAVIFEAGVVKAGGVGALAKAADLDILEAHLRSGADYFVTRDGHFIASRDTLRHEFGITVLTPAEALVQIGPLDPP